MTSKTISFQANDWLTNAALVGLTNVLGKDHYQIDEDNDQIVVPVEELKDNFAQKYFDHLTSHYGKYSKYFTDIVNKREIFQQWIDKNYDPEIVTPTQIKEYDTWLREKFDIFITSHPTILKALPECQDQDIQNLKQRIAQIKREGKKLHKSASQKEAFYEKDIDGGIKLLKQVLPQVVELLNLMAKPENSKPILQHYLPYTIIKNFWQNISFFNTSSSTGDLVKDYDNTFVQPLLEYLKAPNKYQGTNVCANCGREIKEKIKINGPKNNAKLYDNSVWVNTLGYDLKRKTSNAYNMKPVDDGFCVVCRFLYSFGPFGFNYNIINQGLFINDNSSINHLISQNAQVQKIMANAYENKNEKISPQHLLVNTIHNQILNQQTNLLNNVQIIFYNQEHYETHIISHLSDQIFGQLLKDQEDNYFTPLNNTWIDNYGYIDDLIIEHILNRQDLTPLLLKILRMHASDYKDLHLARNYAQKQLETLVLINNIMLSFYTKGDEAMTTPTSEQLKNAKKKGYGMFKYYQENENAKKANTLAYHLLTALKNKDYNAFTATIIKVYASRYTPVPAFFVSSLSNKTAFEQYALAYIAGLIQKNN